VFFLLSLVHRSTFGSEIPAYLVHNLEEIPPLANTFTPYPTHGPYSSPIGRVEIGQARTFVANDNQLWYQDYDKIWKVALFTSGKPSLVRAIGQTIYLDAPQGFAAIDENTIFPRNLVRPPGRGLITELLPFREHFVAANGSAKILTTDDFGTWENWGVLPADTYELLAATGGVVYTVGKASRELLTSAEKEGAWQPVTRLKDNFGRLNQLTTSTDATLWLATSTGIYQSRDQGKQWSAVEAPARAEIFSLAIRDQHMLAGTDSGLWEKTAGGAWTHLEADPARPQVGRIRAIDGVLYACTNYGLQVSTDLGNTWSPGANLGSGQRVGDVATFEGVEYAGTENGLFRRVPGSDQWTPMPLKGDLAQLLFNSAAWVVLTNAKSPLPPTTFISLNRGATWSEARMPGVHLGIRGVVKDNIFFLASDAGAFELKPPSLTWIPVPNGLPTPLVHTVATSDKQVLSVANSRFFVLEDPQTSTAWKPLTEAITPVANLLTYDVASLKSSPPILLAATSSGVFWKGNSSTFIASFPPVQATLRFTIAYSIAKVANRDNSQDPMLFIGTDQGVWYLKDNVPRFTGVLGLWNRAVDFYNRHSNEPWFWILSFLGGLLTTYAMGMIALLLAYWLGANVFVGRPWLLTFAEKPLQVVPRLGRWALFVGYRKRLKETVPTIAAAGTGYFGLTARMPGGEISRPDATGDILHHHLAAALKDSRHLVLTGKAGAGKTTVLARLAWLCLEKQGPSSLKDYLPIFVSGASYKGDLLRAISDTIRKRDGVPVDEGGQTIRAQLTTGNILVLFDGFSEVEGDKTKALQDMVEIASSGEFARCRFIFSGRPLEFFPAKAMIFELQPLDLNTIRDVYLPCFEIERPQQERVMKQLTVFGDKPVDPLLLTMAVADRMAGEASETRSGLFVKYFRRLMKLESPENELGWEGWKFCLEQIAEWSLLLTGKRGLGLAHRVLIDRIAGKTPTPGDPLFLQLKRYYRLPVKDELEVLETLQSSSILKRDDSWKFAHDAYEEFFAAWRIRNSTETLKAVPELTNWLSNPNDFRDVLTYLAEITPPDVRETIRASSWPELWRRAVTGD
jgi:hypothetical protein